MISLIWAEDLNGYIGLAGGLPWSSSMKDDMTHFKNTTMNHTVVMGRNTFDSMKKRPLPGRKNIVLSRDLSYTVPEGVTLIRVPEEVADHVKKDEETFIIGGRTIYRAFADIADNLYVTQIQANLKGDTKMCDIDYDKYKLISKESLDASENAKYPRTVSIYTLDV